MSSLRLIVDKQSFDEFRTVDTTIDSDDLADGQVCFRVDQFALTSNNLSYAGAGDFLGYWSFFPTDDSSTGCIPVWGYATAVASRSPDISTGERVFGYLPFGEHFVVAPDAVEPLMFVDASSHRAALHPWYNRYYRTSNDPVSAAGWNDVQPALWALFMTGWMLARQLDDVGVHGASSVVVASASSKTAYSFAHALQSLRDDVEIIALTSERNAAFVTELGCYDTVVTYDNLQLPAAGSAVFVDMAGNAQLAGEVHTWFGDRLVDSVRIGATHRHARGDSGEMPGPTPRFFFIPDVADARSAEIGHAAFHDEFATAWAPFASWASGFTTVQRHVGLDAIRAAYADLAAGTHSPSDATLLSF